MANQGKVSDATVSYVPGPEGSKKIKSASATGGYQPVDFTYTEHYPGAGTFIKGQGAYSDQLSIYRQSYTKWTQSIYTPGKTMVKIGSVKEKNDILIEDDDDVDAVHTSLIYLGHKIFVIERGEKNITYVNGVRSPTTVLEDKNPFLLTVGRTNFIVRPKRSIPAKGQKTEYFSLKTPKGEQQADIRRCNLLGSHASCDLKFEGPEFAAMIIPHGKNIYLIPLVDMIYNGSPLQELQPAQLVSGVMINNIEATVVIPEGLTGGAEYNFSPMVPECLKFTEILASEDIGPIKMKLPPAGATFIVSRKKASEYFYIKSEFISREHAQVIVYDRSIIVEDLKSRNGSYVNGEKINRKVIWPGDFLSLGDRTFLLGYSVKPES